ncbi:hypothetical protein C8R46DRAFT_1329206 [Mycena filopes]|nr:hypothetical protein C8R46DRAFT_1329206 [Mycena filopes]
MFQVAAHPQHAPFPAAHAQRHPTPAPSSSSSRRHGHGHRDSHSGYRDAPAPHPLTLPRTLDRPPFTDIPRAALAAAAPDLAAAGVPAEFIRHGLRAKAAAMAAGIAALAPSHLPPSIPRAHLPDRLTIPLRAPAPGSGAPSPSYPTHALAIGQNAKAKDDGEGGGGEEKKDALIFPVHAVVLAAHCAKLPVLPPPSRSSSSSRGSAHLTLPILPIALPSQAAFSILHAFMYTHRIDAALGALLPLPPAFLASLAPPPPSSSSHASSNNPHAQITLTLSSPPTLHALSSHLLHTSSHSLTTLYAHSTHVKELWHDMVALGVYDPVLWDALDLAWAVVLGAMNLGAASGAAGASR